MSHRHAWLAFTVSGPALPRSGVGDAAAWQEGFRSLQERWYAVDAPHVAAAMVLQWVLQVPAHTAAHAASSGPYRAELTTLTYSLGPAFVPDLVRLTSLVPDAGGLTDRMQRAEQDYRAVAQPLATSYPAIVRLGAHTRAGMVSDMWRSAEREALGAAGAIQAGALTRESCCLIYALPGCVECAGCPRLRTAAPPA